MNSKALKLAHKIKSNFSTWSQALVCAWAKIKLQSKLKAGVASFSFIKKNGEVRQALGTLLFDTPYISTSTKVSPWHIVKFFDTVKNAWRSMDIRTLIK